MDMPEHATGTREGWLAARLEFLAAEKELSRRGHELARQRQALPWVPIDKGPRRYTTTQITQFGRDLGRHSDNRTAVQSGGSRAPLLGRPSPWVT